MDIEKLEAPGETLLLRFSDAIGTPCSLYVTENRRELQFELDTDFSQFSQEDIKSLLPYLQAYAETGTLELPKQEDEEENLEEELAMQEAGIAMAANIVDQGKRIEELQGDLASAVSHIKDLEQLLREWKKYGQPLSGAKSSDELIDLTERLLEEEE